MQVEERLKNGAGGRNRTDTLSPELDFESSASTSSATPAYGVPEHPSRFAPILHLALSAPIAYPLTYLPNLRNSNDFHFLVKNRRMVDKTLFESAASAIPPHPHAGRTIAAARPRSTGERMRARVGAVGEARQAERRRVDDRRGAGDEVGDEPAGAGADAEAVAGEAGGDVEAGQRIDRGDHRHRIRHHVDHAAPALLDPGLAEHRKRLGDAGAGAGEHERVGGGVE